MTALFKPVGLALIVFSSTLFGFFQSYKLKYRLRFLRNFNRSLSELKERIRFCNDEISELIECCFEENMICDEKGKKYVENRMLKTGDLCLINDFLEGLGMNERSSECERIELYISLLEKNVQSAETDWQNLSKLYKTSGFLCGLFITLMLL